MCGVVSIFVRNGLIPLPRRFGSCLRAGGFVPLPFPILFLFLWLQLPHSSGSCLLVCVAFPIWLVVLPIWLVVLPTIWLVVVVFVGWLVLCLCEGYGSGFRFRWFWF